MDAYASRSDLATRFSDEEVSELESMHVDGLASTENALTDATEQMNSYLSVRYNVPLKKTEHLKLVCCNIARYLLYMNQATDEVEARYKEAVRWLEAVASGKAKVTFAEPLTPDEQKSTYVRPAVAIGSSYPGSVFGDDVFGQMPIVGRR